MKGIKKQKKLLHVVCASTMLVGTSLVSVPLYATEIQAEDRQEQIRQADDVKQLKLPIVDKEGQNSEQTTDAFWQTQVESKSMPELKQEEEGDPQVRPQAEEGRSVAGTELSEPTAINKVFPDAALARLIAKVLNKTAVEALITQADLNGVLEFDTGQLDGADASNIVDLTGLQYLTNLTVFLLGNANVSDISALSGLTNLRELYIFKTKIADLTPLSNLVQLEGLRLDNNNISDIKPLARLINLKELNLGQNNIREINALAKLPKLQIVALSENKITDVDPLRALFGLGLLYLDGNEIHDVSPLGKLNKLYSLNLGFNKIHDTTPLASLINLSALELVHNEIDDVSPLGDLVNLQKLTLGNNVIRDVSALARLGKLIELELGNNDIHNIEPLSQLVNVTALELYGNALTDVSALSNLVNLFILRLDNNRLRDVQGLEKLPYLQDLDLSNNKIQNMHMFGNIASLRKLNLSHNELQDISPLSHSGNLHHLNLNGNKINDVKPLSNMLSLRILELGDNQISDMTPLNTLVELWILDLNNNVIRDVSMFGKTAFPLLYAVDLSDNDIVDLTPFRTAQLPELELMLLDNQSNSDWIDLLDTAVIHDIPTMVENQIKDVDGSLVVPSELTDNGRYEAPYMVWDVAMKNEVMSLSYKWLKSVNIAGVAVTYSGTHETKVLPHYTVNFIVDERVYASTDTAYTRRVEEPTKPEKAGEKFLGWYTAATGGEAWNFAEEKMPANALTLYAQFSPVTNVDGERTETNGDANNNETGKTKPSVPGVTNAGKKGSQLPKTGGYSFEHIVLGIALFGGSIAALMVGYLKNKRKENK